MCPDSCQNDLTSPLVSVIVNCYNGEVYLREAIDSVYRQTYSNWEIIFWDNASTDSSPQIANSYDERLKYFRGGENIALGAARNEAVKKARGDFIAFIDCDDIWMADKLDRQVQAMADGVSALCYGGLITINSRSEQIGYHVHKQISGNLFEKLLLQFDANLPTAFIRKATLDREGLVFDGNMIGSEEYCLFMQLAVNNQFVVIPEVLAKYRIHDSALTNKSIARWAEEREYTLDLIRRNHPGIEERYRRGFQEAFARARYYRARYYMYQGMKSLARKEMWQNVFIDSRYKVLYLLLLFPAFVWDYVHKIRTSRSQYG